jgi:DNA-binding CsgD family transcriptional regulator
MSKSLTDKSMQSERLACKSLNSDESHAEALRILERENHSLRALVVSLSEVVRRQVAQSSLGAKSHLGEQNLDGTSDHLSRPLTGHELLTEREQMVLAHIVRGASSREAARLMSISARTVEYHRANIMLKVGARNTAELVRIVLGDWRDASGADAEALA